MRTDNLLPALLAASLLLAVPTLKANAQAAVQRPGRIAPAKVKDPEPEKAPETLRMCYKGIPITGTEDAFGAELGKIGYRKSGPEEYTGPLSGRQVSLRLHLTPASGQVWGVSAAFPAHGDWRSVKNEYDTVSAMLTAKYGKRSESHERFQPPYREGDGYEMKAISIGKYRWHGLWETGEGVIRLSVEKVKERNRTEACTVISYMDKTGAELNTKEISQEYKDL